jgi:pimeloyl-ACP methyl ester carboxylesterase
MFERFPEVLETRLALNGLVRRFRRTQRTRGTLVVIHGINPRGAFDSRLEHVAKAFAAIGFDVYMPNIPALEQLLVQPSAIDQIEELVLSLTQEPKYCPEGRLNLFSASISGAMSLIAATRPSIRERIKAICVVGGFASTATVSQKILALPPEADDYGRNVMFYNFAEYALGPNEDLRHAFYLAIHDNHFLRRGTEREELPKYLLGVDPSVSALYWRLQNDISYRMQIAEEVMVKTSDLMRTLSPVEYVHKLRCRRIALVHGKYDEVVPFSEAELLYHSLRAADVETELCITGFIGHGDKLVPPDSLGIVLQDAMRMVETWASFIEAAAYEDNRKQVRLAVLDAAL